MEKPKQYINTSKKQLSQKNKISHKPLHTNAVQRSKFPYQKTEISTENPQNNKELLRVKTGYNQHASLPTEFLLLLLCRFPSRV